MKFLKPLSDKTTPRWIILLLDLMIVACSYTLVLLSEAFRNIPTQPLVILQNYAILLGVFLIVSFFTKSYAYIIRLSALDDLYRLFISCFISTAIVAVINIAVKQATGAAIYSLWGIVFTVMFSFFLMMAERLAVKYFYNRLAGYNNHRKRVLVLGTSMRSIVIAESLRAELKGKYKPVALLSMDADATGMSQKNSHPVYPFRHDSFDELIEKLRISAVLIAPENLKFLRSKEAEPILENGVRLLTINHVERIDVDEQNTDSAQPISSGLKEIKIEDLLGRDPIITDNKLVRRNIYFNTILITGACGSIGSEITRQVAACKAKQIVCIDQAETPMHDLMLEMKAKFPDVKIIHFIGSVQNQERMELAFSTYRPVMVIHAAAYKHVPMMEINPTEAIINNVLGTKVIADLSVKYGVHKFVMVSTDKAVNPTNVMGATKRISEIYTQSLFFYSQKKGKHTQFITTRFGNVLGSNGSVIPLFRRQIENGGPVTITHRDIIRYFMTIPEACSLVLEAGCMGNGGEIYIFDMGEPVKIYDLATKMISLAGYRPGIDIQIVETGLRPGEKLYEELLNDKESTTATINEKIMIAKVNQYDYGSVRSAISEIIDYARHGNAHDMILAMKRFVPEYKSNNSEFESIDQELNNEKKSNQTTIKHLTKQ